MLLYCACFLADGVLGPGMAGAAPTWTGLRSLVRGGCFPATCEVGVYEVRLYLHSLMTAL